MFGRFSTYALISVFALVSACSTTSVQPDPQTPEAHYQPIHISAGKTIASDTKNIKYDENETTTTVAKVPVMPELKDEKQPNNTKVKKNIPIIRQPAPRPAPSVNYQIANILFADGSSSVASEYRSAIAKAASIAKKHNAIVRVYGFASSRTRNTDIATHKSINLKVSLQRAQNVAAALRRAGVKKENIIIEALSDSYPLYSEAMPEGERLNRRAEIYISY